MSLGKRIRRILPPALVFVVVALASAPAAQASCYVCAWYPGQGRLCSQTGEPGKVECKEQGGCQTWGAACGYNNNCQQNPADCPDVNW